MEKFCENDKVKDANISLKEKVDKLKNEVEKAGFLQLGVCDALGNVEYTNETSMNVLKEEYFTQAISGQSYVTEPFLSKTTNSMIIIYAIPIRSGSRITGALIGMKDGTALCDYTNKIKVGNTSVVYIIGKAGTTIAHMNRDSVLKGENDFKSFKKNPELKELIEIEKKMLNGETGAGSYKYNLCLFLF